MPDLAKLLGPNDQLLLVGGGRMGGAMLKGWLNDGLAPSAVRVQEPSPSDDLVQTQVSISPPGSVDAPVAIMVLAIKPQLAPEILPQLGAAIGADTLVISLMAGLSLSAITSLCGAPAGHYVRAMPNTPAMLGRGITALVAQNHVPEPARLQAQSLMAAVGDTLWVDDERAIDAVTAVSGSGPAYVFYLVEAMAAAGQRLGLSSDTAMALARATVAGAGAMLDQLDDSAQILRENVTSPGGTTAAALDVLMASHGLHALMATAIGAAHDRARELSEPDGD